jgi:hypothetical protein
LLSGLPVYRALSADIGALARGETEMPWVRRALSSRYRVRPLDTLASVPGIAADAPPTDPLAGLDRLAVLQPRALSPADNVALDDWVREGGRLLLVLDPALTGDYELPLGDPRRPNATALIPPVVARWGLSVAYDDTQAPAARRATYPGGAIPLAMPGQLGIRESTSAQCRIAADRALARCRVGQGQVTLLADAGVFEHRDLAREASGDADEAILDLFAYALRPRAAPGKITGTRPESGSDIGD